MLGKGSLWKRWTWQAHLCAAAVFVEESWEAGTAACESKHKWLCGLTLRNRTVVESASPSFWFKILLASNVCRTYMEGKKNKPILFL